MGGGIDWAEKDVGQLHDWLHENGEPLEMQSQRPEWSLDSSKSKLKQLRRGAPEQSRPLKRRRTIDVARSRGRL